ncbi:MAG: aldehyde ferredoxin oxidoreductase C-terminal domain-containing protein [Desulfovermiculus sp.]|nr:aldehyde ferredoxin oxidoreductase C-terminal domain-containing protein [Desulfovermiculus sp.]
MPETFYGWTGRILHVDLTREDIAVRSLPLDLTRKFIGQSGINAALLSSMAVPEMPPLSPEAPLIFGVGPLGGTMAPCSGRFTLTFKSPLTGIFADSNCGGHFGPELKMAGYDHILITGMAQALGFLPTRNFQASTFEGAQALCGDELTAHYLQRHKGCFNCPISCSKYCAVSEGPYAGAQGEGPEYETLSAFGSKLGNENLPAVIQANALCNQLGLDTISTGNTIAWVMECCEREVFHLPEEERICFGQHTQVIDMIKAIVRREGIGHILAQGAPAASRILGGEDYVVHSKGLDYPAVDVRGTKGMALAFAVSPRGGDHLKGLPMFELAPEVYAQDIHNQFGFSPQGRYWLEYQTKPELIRWHEDWHCVVDSLGLCKLEGIALKPLLPEHFRDLLHAATGWDVSVQELRLAGERIWNLERLFNVRLGLGRKDDFPPKRLLQEPISTGPAQGETLDVAAFEAMLDAYYKQRGWDRVSGEPLPEKLQELSLL